MSKLITWDPFKELSRLSAPFLTRSFALPENADGSGVKAEFKEGVLRVTPPKIEPEGGSGKVEVPVS